MKPASGYLQCGAGVCSAPWAAVMPSKLMTFLQILEEVMFVVTSEISNPYCWFLESSCTVNVCVTDRAVRDGSHLSLLKALLNFCIRSLAPTRAYSHSSCNIRKLYEIQSSSCSINCCKKKKKSHLISCVSAASAPNPRAPSARGRSCQLLSLCPCSFCQPLIIESPLNAFFFVSTVVIILHFFPKCSARSQ